MSNEERIRESIDSCRPESADLDLPEFDALRDAVRRDATQKRIFERSQAFDAAVGEQIRSVEIPAGLVNRLLGGLDVSTEDAPTSVRRSQGLFWGTVSWKTVAGATALVLLFAVGRKV